MIVSCSRRTDIPAFYSEWFINRVHDGYCLVPNPFNAKQISKISLAPQDVDAIVFWSKNPAPLLGKLDELTERGYIYYFSYTINGYPSELEPEVPQASKAIATIDKISRRLGPWGVVWRYDPIIISDQTTWKFHEENFAYLCRLLSGKTRRVVISILDMYAKTKRRVNDLLDHDALSNAEDMLRLLKTMSAIANDYGMEIRSCAEKRDYSDVGIPPGKCIDDEIIRRLGGNVSYHKDGSQRSACLCSKSRDIGMTDTCGHGCMYCYATRNSIVAKRRLQEHDPKSPVLWGHLDSEVLRKYEVAKKQLKLF